VSARKAVNQHLSEIIRHFTETAVKIGYNDRKWPHSAALRGKRVKRNGDFMRQRVILLVLILLVAAVPTAYAQVESEPVRHIVQPGDTLYRIALRYGVPMDSIASANNIADYSRILTGQELVIPGLSLPTSSADVINPLIAGTPIVHEVTYGDTLEAIANKYSTTVDLILKGNNIVNANYISPGLKLNIWSSTAAAAENASAAVGGAGGQNATHTVQRGEILASIARQYGVSVADVIRANNITNPDRILAGQQLIIPGVSAEVAARQGMDYASLQGTNYDRGLVTHPDPAVKTGKFILVDLSESMTYAFLDGKLVYSALVSTGLPATPTVVGQFRIYLRYDAQTMSGPGYYLPGVPYVQYFYQGYALHGTYWHSNFGQPMSHGCVNLRNDDALWFYNFGEIGTPVYVQY
jgi:LysM repeat protein